MNKKLIVYLVSFAAFLGPFTQTIYAPIIPEVTKQFQSTPFLVNLTISIFTFFLALMQIVYGPLTDTKGRRKIILFGIAVYVLASLGCFFSNSIGVLLFFRAMQAIGIAAGSVVAVTVIGDLFEGKSRGKAMGTFQTMVSLGPVAGPVIGGFLGGRFDFHAVFLALMVTGIIIFSCNFMFLKETKPAGRKEQPFRAGDFITILRDQAGFAIILLGFIQYYTFYNFLVFLPGILTEQYGLNAEQKGMVFLPLSLFMVIGSSLGGLLQENVEGKKILVSSSFLNVLVIFSFIFVSWESLSFLIGTLILYGLFFGMSLPVQTTILTQVFRSNRATAVGVYNFFRFMGMACGPLLGTILLDLGGYSGLFGFIVVVFAGCAFFLNCRLRTGRTEQTLTIRSKAE